MKFPRRPCSRPGCPGLRVEGSRYCESCKPEPVDDGRESAAARGYGSAHRRWREMVLRRDPLCVMCEKVGRVEPSVIADHIKPLAQGGAPFDMANGQGLCMACHNRKTASDVRRG